MQQEKVRNAIARHGQVLNRGFLDRAGELSRFSDQVVQAFNEGRKLLVIGHGILGPAANLVANLFVHRLSLERPQLPALSLCHDQTLALALGRTGSGQEYFSRQLQVVAQPGDVLLVLSDGQHDPALEVALAEARERQCAIVTLVAGKGDGFCEAADICFPLPAESALETVECACFFGRLLCELVEHELFGI